METEDREREEKRTLKAVEQCRVAGPDDQRGRAQPATKCDRRRHQSLVPYNESGDVERRHACIVHCGDATTHEHPAEGPNWQAPVDRRKVREPSHRNGRDERQEREDEIVSCWPVGTEGKHRNKVRSPNGKAVGHRRCGKPTPTATPLRNVHVIEQSNRGVRTERAHTKSKHYQAIVVLLREAIQDSEHDFP